MTKLARLKPFDGKKHVLRSYSVFGIQFKEQRGWYRVDDDVAEYLKSVKQVETDEYAAPAFDVCTEEEAKHIDDTEKKQEERRKAEAANPTAKRIHHATRATPRRTTDGTLTTEDLPKLSDFDKESGEFEDDMAPEPERVEAVETADAVATPEPPPAKAPKAAEAKPAKGAPRPRVGRARGPQEG